MIDNFDNIYWLIPYMPDTYIKFEAIVRSKDGDDGLIAHSGSSSLKSWLINDLNEYLKLKPIMIEFCNRTNARLYVTLDKKSTKKTFANIIKNFADINFEILCGGSIPNAKKMQKIIKSETSKKDNTSKNAIKTWLIDLDVKNEWMLNVVKDFCGDNYICTLNTPNGYHIVAKKKFNSNKFIDLLETVAVQKSIIFPINERDKKIEELLHNIALKENALGLIYYKEG